MGRTALPYEERTFPTKDISYHFWMVFVQWKVRGKILNRGWLQKVSFCECSDNPATGHPYSSLGQAERACRDLDDEYIPTIVEFGANQLENIAFTKETK